MFPLWLQVEEDPGHFPDYWGQARRVGPLPTTVPPTPSECVSTGDTLWLWTGLSLQTTRLPVLPRLDADWYFSKALYSASQRFCLAKGIAMARDSQYSVSFELSRVSFFTFSTGRMSLEVKSNGACFHLPP